MKDKKRKRNRLKEKGLNLPNLKDIIEKNEDKFDEEREDDEDDDDDEEENTLKLESSDAQVKDSNFDLNQEKNNRNQSQKVINNQPGTNFKYSFSFEKNPVTKLILFYLKIIIKNLINFNFKIRIY